MRTIELKVYTFDELSEQAKEKARKWYRNEIQDFDWMYDDAQCTAIEFEKHFPTSSRASNSWLDAYTIIGDEVEALRGQRLKTYIRNNYGHILFKGKYYGKLVNTHKDGTPIEKCKEHPAGVRHVKRYSKIFKGRNCNLTGHCYDEDMLDPLYQFLEGTNYQSYSFSDLLEECYRSLEKSLKDEEEYRSEDSYIDEEIEGNNYEFNEKGEKF
jgi:hypothetical protein